MNKKIYIGICATVILVLVILFVYIFSPKLSQNEEYLLYSKIESIMLESEQEQLNNYKVFLSMKRFGYDKEKDNTYIYCWIQTESFFVNEEGRVEMYEGSSIPYKFTFKGEEYIGYEVPKDGRDYQESINELFPFSVRSKFDSIYEDDYLKNEIIKQVESYYNINIEDIYY